MELTEVFFDTNFLRKKNIKDFSKFNFGIQFEDFIDFLGTNDVIDHYKINISEITIKELEKQIKDKYKDELIKLKESYNKFKNIYNIKFNVDEDVKYDEILQKLIIEYAGFYNINIVETESISFQSILNRAINKKKPFIGENSESDKGFKDAVLWESIIEYAKKSKNKNFILFTKNTKDFSEVLEKEFEKLTGKKIEIIYEISKLQERILIEQSENLRNILTLELLEEDKKDLIEKVNRYFQENDSWKNYQMSDIKRIEDFVNKGNDFYSFMIFEMKEEIEMQWYVEVSYKDDELSIDNIIPCA